MQLPESQTKFSRAHPLALWLGRLVAPLDRGLAVLYGARFNPFHRSGTLAVGLLSIVILTGFILLFFYRLGSPFESVQEMTAQWYLGRWLRAVHRYCSDAAVVATGLHVLKMFVEGRSWGARFLAWITGLILGAVLMISALTGYVLVWDQFGQLIAQEGARIVDGLGILSLPLSSAFSGAQPVLGSFFFMNLFLHVALPLAAILGLWLHTFRLARSDWMPPLRELGFISILLIPATIWFSAPLGQKADLLRLIGTYPADLFFLFWLPLSERLSPTTFAWASIFAFVGAALIPFALKPRASMRPAPSLHQPEICSGCSQCEKDCPFDAITMVPRSGPKPSELATDQVAHVNPDLCVSCGICAASCSEFAIGPPGRSGRDQLRDVRSILDQATQATSEIGASEPKAPGARRDQTVLIYCESRPPTRVLAQRLHALEDKLAKSTDAASPQGQDLPSLGSLQSRRAPILYGVDCMGSLHTGVLTSLLTRFERICLVGCPPHGCIAREGPLALAERISGVRTPTLPPRISRQRLLNLTEADFAPAERQRTEERYTSFVKSTAPESPAIDPAEGSLSKRVRDLALPTASTLGLFGLIYLLSGFTLGVPLQQGALRLSWRLPGQVSQVCRTRSPEELSQLPAHMRTPLACVRSALTYRLTVNLDAQPLLNETIAPQGARMDRPLTVDRLIGLPPGLHQVEVRFTPENAPEPTGSAPAESPIQLSHRFEMRLQAGQIALVTLDSLKQAFVVKGIQ